MGKKRQRKLTKRQIGLPISVPKRVEVRPNLFGYLVLEARKGAFGTEYAELADVIWKAGCLLDQVARKKSEPATADPDSLGTKE